MELTAIDENSNLKVALDDQKTGVNSCCPEASERAEEPRKTENQRPDLGVPVPKLKENEDEGQKAEAEMLKLQEEDIAKKEKCRLKLQNLDVKSEVFDFEAHECEEVSEFDTTSDKSGNVTLLVAVEQKVSVQKIAEDLDEQSNECILEPLSFPETPATVENSVDKPENLSFDQDFEAKFPLNDTPCIFCENMYRNIKEKSQKDEYLCHMIVEHKLVIADVKLIANLRSYAIYWKKRLMEKPIEEFCTSINTNMSPKDEFEREKYFLLCDALTEDRKVREKLQLERLKELLEEQTAERNNEEFERMCLFCTKFFIGNRNDLFTHMNEDHNFNVGHPHNLIYVEEFLTVIENKLNCLECLFCDKVFKDRASLREHMRKKSHRRLNPKNNIYDKYYIINYLELGKNWELLQGEPDQLESGDDWSGWEDDGGQTAVCFFCTAAFNTQDRVFGHMRGTHDFDYCQMRRDMNLSFYQQVKMVNYIRRTVHQLRETEKKGGASAQDENASDTWNKFASTIKQCILSSTKWNQPQYYFPTYENDTLLCQLEDKEGMFEPEDTFIIGEDGIDCKAIINESILTDLVVQGYFD